MGALTQHDTTRPIPTNFTWVPTQDRNEGTSESWANELHEHAQSTPQVTT